MHLPVVIVDPSVRPEALRSVSILPDDSFARSRIVREKRRAEPHRDSLE
jgi:hypothetical protein